MHTTHTANFLPISKADLTARGWDYVDFICVTGDAYVDHPSFGIAILSRMLEREGYRVAVLAQPDWRDPELLDFKRFGRPRHGFLVTGGNIDSMVSHYTVSLRRRSDDAYTAGNRAGSRPDRAATVYSNCIRRAYGDVPIVLGGLEASLRRFAHYDYWSDSVRPSVLVESGADLLVYGMGEKQLTQIASRLAAGEGISTLTDILGTCFLGDATALPTGSVSCAGFSKVAADKTAYARATAQQLGEQDSIYGRPIVQQQGDGVYLVQNPPMPPLATAELDRVFELPFMRAYHPSYEALGGVKAIEEVEFSIMHNRGCFGFCNFCSIASHQGRSVTARSHESVLREAEGFVDNPRFKGYIHDVGGPTANFTGPSCEKQIKDGLCPNKKCLGHRPCPSLVADHTEYLALLRGLRRIKGVKKVFVRSGIRFDYLLEDKHSDEFFSELVEHHVSGQLKVAPEHCSDAVLSAMGKPPISVYRRFSKKFYETTKSVGKEQYLVPYLMSSHPGSTLRDALELSLFLREQGLRPEQVQDFYPTPGTVSTCMFYTGLDPFTLKPVYVPRTPQEKATQRALLQYFKPQNRRPVLDALVSLGREDLIGTGRDCLVVPDADYLRQKSAKSGPAGPKTAGPAGDKKPRGSRSERPGSRRGASRNTAQKDSRAPRRGR